MNWDRKAAVVFTVVLFIFVATAGCFLIRRLGDNAEITQESTAPPGTLSGVMYGYSGGMRVRNDFFIWLSPDAIVETFYYPEEPPKGVGWHVPFEKENVPITAEQWTDVEQVVLELYPLMKPKPEPEPTIDLWSILGRWLGGAKDDEVSSSSITLIWDTEEGEQRIKYASPNDKRISTLVALLQELADPIGREIPR